MSSIERASFLALNIVGGGGGGRSSAASLLVRLLVMRGEGQGVVSSPMIASSEGMAVAGLLLSVGESSSAWGLCPDAGLRFGVTMSP